jgi:PAS domain S-box-containing protein
MTDQDPCPVAAVDPRWERRFRAVSAVLSVSVVAIGLVVLVGWLFDIALFKSIHVAFTTMKASTAVLLIPLGIGLWLARSRAARAIRTKRILGIIVALGAAVTFAEYVLDIDLGSDALLVLHWGNGAHPGRTSPATCLTFLMLGLALVVQDRPFPPLVSRAIGLLAEISALIVLFGYLYSAPSLYAIGIYASLALHTAIAFLLAGAALLLARPTEPITRLLTSDSAAGRLLRRLLPAIVLVPVSFGWVQLQGQAAGYYDRHFGVALMTLSTVVALTGVGSIIAASLHRTELRGRELEAARQRLLEDMRLARTRLEADVEAMTRLNRVASLFIPQAAPLQPVLAEVVAAAVAISHADFGDIQILDPRSGDLHIVAQQGCPSFWLEFWDHVSRGQGTCGTALERGSRVIVEDLEHSAIFANTRALEIQREAGIRAAQSTPLFTRSGEPIGMFSTHYTRPHRPDERTLRLLDLLARQAADIIERALSDQRLRDSEQRFRALVDASAQIVWSSDATGTVHDSSSWCGFTGQAPDQLHGSGWLDAVHPEDRDRVAGAWRDAVHAKVSLAHEFRVRHRSGQWRWMSVRAVPLHDPEGNLRGWIGMDTDITAQRESEDAMRATQELLRLAQRVARIGTFDMNLQSDVNMWTPELERMHGLPVGGFVRTRAAWEALLHPDDRAYASRRVEEAFATEAPVEAEWRVCWPDGSMHWLSARFQVFKDSAGRPQRVIGINIEITERKRAEEQRERLLAEIRDLTRNLEARVEARTKEVAVAMDRLDGVISMAADAIIAIDDDQGITIFNRGAEEIFGWKRHEVLGKPLDLLLPERLRGLHRARVVSFGREPTSSRPMAERSEVLGLRKTGEEFPAEAAISKQQTDGGTQFTVILRDITARKRLEAEQARTYAERAVLLKEIHHRVKNNLQVISSLFYLQAQRTEQDNVRKLLDESRGRLQSIALIHEKLYRSEHLASIDFGDYLRDLTANLTSAIGAQAPHVTVRVEADQIFLDIERAIPCALIVNELASNSMKHAFPGGQHGDIRIVVTQADSELDIEVTDTGIGFPAGLDFQRVTTLGLQLVMSLTRQLRGTVELVRGAGTTFRIHVPVHAAAHPTEAARTTDRGGP